MYIDINDPKDPWAWRNKWNGDARNGMDDLWIWVTICVCLAFLTFLAILPLLLLKFCRGVCPCNSFFNCFEGMLSQCSKMGERKRHSPGFKRFQEAVRVSKHIIRDPRKIKNLPSVYYIENPQVVPKINLSAVNSK
uniref:Uncharacterized protein n=1 Tax=Rhabditophanes sp. KR3021 TaxID=114890 RepID=A0AC35TK34_9BILA